MRVCIESCWGEIKTIELNGFDYIKIPYLYDNMNKWIHDGDNIINMKWIV